MHDAALGRNTLRRRTTSGFRGGRNVRWSGWGIRHQQRLLNVSRATLQGRPYTHRHRWIVHGGAEWGNQRRGRVVAWREALIGDHVITPYPRSYPQGP
jgi:hypothetical protein